VILFEVESIVGWVDGTLVFVEEQMTEVIKELERWYGVEIIIAPGVDLSGRINGKYTNAPLDVVLKGIGFTSDFSFEMEGKAVYINK
jgi:ferric-dicitrate binding protein FerR (iron transport regulator)